MFESGVYNLIARTMANQDAVQAQRDAANAQTDVDTLRDQVDHMALIVHAIWTLAREKLGLTDEELTQRVHDIDLSDGKLDGKMSPQARPCAKCGRMMPPRRMRCLYCGTPYEPLAAT